MAKLIDLEKIKPIDFPSVEMDGLDVVRYLNTLPTVDAVEVVRCKDCNKWHRHTEVDRERGECRRYQTTKHENGYCDRGERKDNETD